MARETTILSAEERSRWTTLSILLILQVPIAPVRAAPCQVCTESSTELNSNSRIHLDKPITLTEEPYASLITTCGDLERASAFVDESDDDCSFLQSFSTYCGCPVPENACQVCEGHENLVANDNNVFVNDFLPAQALGLANPTCDMVQSLLHSVAFDSSECLEGQALLKSHCHCQENREESSTPLIKDSLSSPSPLSTQCTLCSDGSEVGLPFKNISHYLPSEMLSEVNNGTTTTASSNDAVVTCGWLDFVARGSFRGEDSGECAQVRELAGICGCPARDNACSFCGGTSPVPKPKYIVQSIQKHNGYAPTSCEDLELTTTQILKGTRDCYDIKTFSYLCDCNGGQAFSTPAASDNSQDRAAIWIGRCSGIVSFFGSLYILFDIGRQRKRTGSLTVRQEILVGLHLFDLINSFAWATSTLFIPRENEYGEPTGVYGARGTEGTCKFQGFLIQLGLTAAFYNACLSIYYMLVVRNGWREERMRKCLKWFHCVSIVGLGFALAGIPFYEAQMACYVPAPPYHQNYWPISIFLVIPLGTAALIVNGTMLLLYNSVRSQENSANRWRISPNTSSLKQAVFWQCFWFLLAFDLSWPIFIVTTMTLDFTYYKESFFWLFAVTVFLTPLQGFFNCLVYLRVETRKNPIPEQRRTRTGWFNGFRSRDPSVLKSSSGDSNESNNDNCFTWSRTNGGYINEIESSGSSFRFRLQIWKSASQSSFKTQRHLTSSNLSAAMGATEELRDAELESGVLEGERKGTTMETFAAEPVEDCVVNEKEVNDELLPFDEASAIFLAGK